jgi:AAA family ATP:ADP antiporter
MVIMIWALVSIGVLSLVVFATDPHAPLIGSMPAVAVALIVSRGLAYGMAEPARHSLYTRVPRSVRYKGQNAVDTAVWRFGDTAIALAMNGLRSVGVVTAGFAGLSALAAFTAADDRLAPLAPGGRQRTRGAGADGHFVTFGAWRAR